MRVLLDENLRIDLAVQLLGHHVATVSGERWQGIKNGELLRRAQARFDIFVTVGRNLEFQQNYSEFEVGILLVLAPSNRMVHLRPLVPAILGAMETIHSGELRRVGPR